MAIIGDLQFARWDGPPPPTPAPSVQTFEVPGYPYLGARVHAARSTSADVTLTTFVPVGNASPLIATYNSYIGTSRPVYHAGVLYALAPHSILHFVQRAEVIRIRRLIRARGIWDNGTRFDLWPADEVTSRWTLRPVPVPSPQE